MPVKFGDLQREYSELQSEMDATIQRVLASGWFILGRELELFERAFAAYLNVAHCIGCASGTEAIALALMAIGVGPDDEVITVAHTAVPTISAISMTGARPVFVDIQRDTCLMDVHLVEAAITPHTAAILPVHLYGQCVEMDQLLSVAARHGIPVVEDCAQAHGAMYRDRKAGSMGQIAAFSFYPSKNLGCYGDGGAVVTSDPGLAEKLKMLRNYGQRQRYHHEIVGINSRLDEMQAAILTAKLPLLDAWNRRRQQIAMQYTVGLAGLPLQAPVEAPENSHVYHLYVIQIAERDALQTFLAKRGIQTLIHYPVPAHLQPAYANLGLLRSSLSITEGAADSILSLPMYPHLSDMEIDTVLEAIRAFYA